MKSRVVHALLLVTLAATVGAVLGQGRRTREGPGEVLRALRAARGPALPAPAGAGAASVTDPVRYDRERLYELVDGAAEAYLARGFQACVAATYAFAGSIEVAAEVHRFENPAGALAQLGAERPRKAQAVPSLPAAVSDGQVLLATSGRDLLKLTALTPGSTAQGALAALAAAWHKETTP